MLVERDTELAALRAAVARAVAGAGSTTVLVGPPGIGKTALLGVLASDLSADLAGIRVLRARGGELEREFPHGVMRQLFEATLRAGDERTAVALLSGPARPATGLLGDGSGSVPGDAASLEHAFYWLTVNLSDDAPVVLVVDDAHWADLASLRALVYLARRVADHRVAVVIGTRPGNGSSRALLERLAAEATELSLDPITPAGVERVLRDRLPGADGAFCAACHTASGGNPFLVTELLDAVDTAGLEPVAANAARIRTVDVQNVTRSVLLRMAGLGPHATPVARALAVLGGPAPTDVIADLAGTPVGAAVTALDELRGAHLLAPDDPARFTHSLVADAVYLDIPTATRSHLHGVAARRLARAGSPPDVVAGHLLLTAPGTDRWVFDQLVAAASGGLAASAPETAAAYLARALQETVEGTDRARLLLWLGAARYQTVSGGAVEPLSEALELAVEPASRAEIGRALGSALITESRADECWGLLDRLVTELRPHPGPAADVELFAAQSLYTRTDSTAVQLARVDAWRPDPGGATVRDRSMLATQAWAGMGRIAPADTVAAQARAALSTGTLVADDTYAVSVEMAVWGLVGTGHHAEALTALDTAIDSRRAVGQLLRAATLMVLRAEIRRRVGQLQLAEEDARAAADVITHDQVFAPQLAAVLTFVLLDRGAVVDAQTVLHEQGFDVTVPDSGLHDLLHLARGRLRLAAGDLAGGVQDVLHFGAICTALQRHNPAYYPWRSTAATALVQLGRRDESAALALEEHALAERCGVPDVLGRSLAALATAQRGAQAVDTARTAVDLLNGSALVLEAAEARLVLGRALRIAGRREQAREPLRRALDAATHAGARPLAERARHELLATGARPRRPALRGVGALTPTELRVASLAAQGLTNRELAHTLYVTPKTIETHLAAAYRKLGVAGKGDLAHAMAAG